MPSVSGSSQSTFPELVSTIKYHFPGRVLLIWICIVNQPSDPSKPVGHIDFYPNIYDVEFYPYTVPGVDPVFAFATNTHTVVGRPTPDADVGIEVIRTFVNEDTGAECHMLTWSQDLKTGDPLLCITGHTKKIHVFNVVTGQLVKTLVGHGAPINELCTSPVSPEILATGSEDNSVRIWDLDSRYTENHCRAILAGGGHHMSVLAISFHQNGRYLLSGGHDTRICLWAIPNILNDSEVLSTPGKVPETEVVHYPHFSTTEIHSNSVDCVKFYNDLILSRCSLDEDQRIVLWQINGFSSDQPVPSQESAPAASLEDNETVSGFVEPCTSRHAFQILLTFDTPLCSMFDMRFSLLQHPDATNNPILAMGSENMWISFWNMKHVEQGLLGNVNIGKTAPQSKKTEVRKGNAESDFETEGFSGPQHPIRPHMTVRVPNIGFPTHANCIRYFTWSVGGEWCMFGGDDGLIGIMKREKNNPKFKA